MGKIGTEDLFNQKESLLEVAKFYRDIACPELSDRSIETLLTHEIFVGQKFQKDQPLKMTENLPTMR